MICPEFEIGSENAMHGMKAKYHISYVWGLFILGNPYIILSIDLSINSITLEFRHIFYFLHYTKINFCWHLFFWIVSS